MTTFNPPPGYDDAREDPSYAVRIPFTDRNDPAFEPATIAIPIDMTVIWFNDDKLPHTITLDASNSNVNEGSSFDSGTIPPMGFFIHKFTDAGTHDYYDEMNPFMKGRVVVGDTFEIGDNMDMLVGGNILPFNASQLERLTVSFVPRENATTIPPNLSVTYNVSVANGSSVLYSNEFVDSDGILDLELVPSSSNVTKHFVAWGPDFVDADPAPRAGSDGTFHIQGPIMTERAIYLIQVEIIAKDGNLLPSPITDTFALPSVDSQ
jgi:plastocyanin